MYWRPSVFIISPFHASVKQKNKTHPFRGGFCFADLTFSDNNAIIALAEAFGLKPEGRLYIKGGRSTSPIANSMKGGGDTVKKEFQMKILKFLITVLVVLWTLKYMIIAVY